MTTNQNRQAEEILCNAHNAIRAGRASQRSAWNKGVYDYASDLMFDLRQALEDERLSMETLASPHGLIRVMLNGASSWEEFSRGGCSLVYNDHIAERLCTPSEFERTAHGLKMPNSREDWIDVQTRALFQASRIVCTTINDALQSLSKED